MNPSYHPGRSQKHEKKFSCDDPRGAYDIGLLFIPSLPPHSISPALSAADLLPMDGLPVLMPGLPLPPFCRLAPAMLAAVTRQRMIRPEYPATAFQQTSSAPRSAGILSFMRTCSFGLILMTSWRIFTRAHWSLPLPEGSSPEGDSVPLRGALSASRAQPPIPFPWNLDRK